MTIKEFIVEKLSAWGVEYPTSLIVAFIQKMDIDPNADYKDTPNEKIDLIFYNIIPDLLLMPSSVSEGGYAISYNKQALTNFYKSLCSKLGKVNHLTESNNQIKDISKQW